MYINDQEAVKLLQNGNVVAVPTETVYGLAARADCAPAVCEIFSIKARPTNRPLIIHYGANPLWQRDCIWTEDAELLASRFWPGPLTILLNLNPHAAIVPEAVGFTQSIAVRRSSHPQMSMLCDEVGPLAAPSVNKYQKVSATTMEAATAVGEIPVLAGARSIIGLESTIIDLRSAPYIIRRLGAITHADLSQVVKCILDPSIESLFNQNIHDQIGHLPGSGQHYQPAKPLRINIREVLPGESLLAFGNTDLQAEWVMNLSPDGNLEEAAHNIYYMLDCLSKTSCTRIAATPIPMTGIGISINDKLLRAAWMV